MKFGFSFLVVGVCLFATACGEVTTSGDARPDGDKDGGGDPEVEETCRRYATEMSLDFGGDMMTITTAFDEDKRTWSWEFGGDLEVYHFAKAEHFVRESKILGGFLAVRSVDTREDGEVRTTHYEYDDQGRLTSSTEESDNGGYSDRGELLTDWDADGRPTAGTYWMFGNCGDEESDSAASIAITYDESRGTVNHARQASSPAGNCDERVELRTYNADGNIVGFKEGGQEGTGTIDSTELFCL